MRPRRDRGIPALLLALVVAACTPAVTGSPSQTVNGIPTTSPATTPASVAPSASSPSGSASAVAIDPSLLDVLPELIDGLALDYEPVATRETAADPALATGGAAAIAFAIAVAPDSSDLVVASVMRPKAGRFDDPFFRAWRDSFDQGVCERAGGVAGHSEAQLGGRQVFIATCSQGPVVYHTYLGTRSVLVSVSSLGERRLGEQLMRVLRDR